MPVRVEKHGNGSRREREREIIEPEPSKSVSKTMNKKSAYKSTAISIIGCKRKYQMVLFDEQIAAKCGDWCGWMKSAHNRPELKSPQFDW
jgi:hypothetical protein